MLWRKLQLNWRYAIGEFLIVLVGVLAAFAVDRWYTNQQERLLESEYINALLGDLEKDRASILSSLEGAKTFASRGQVLLSSMSSGEIAVSPTEFVAAAATAAYLRFPTYTRSTIGDLMSTGNLRLIESDEIRALLSDYYTSAENRGQWNQNWREYQVHLGHIVPKFVPLHFRDAYEYQSAGGPPWALKELRAGAEEAESILARMMELEGLQPAIENMVRTQGVHYTYHQIVLERLDDVISALEKYHSKLAIDR